MIDLDTVGENAVEVAFAAVPTAVALGTFFRNVTGEEGSDYYDPETDTVMDPLAVIENVRMLKVSAEEGELAGTNVTVEDVKVLIPGKDLLYYEPTTTDFFDMRGVRYNVVKIKQIPTKALRIVFARKR